MSVHRSVRNISVAPRTKTSQIQLGKLSMCSGRRNYTCPYFSLQKEVFFSKLKLIEFQSQQVQV